MPRLFFHEPPPENPKKGKKGQAADAKVNNYFVSFPLFDPNAFAEGDTKACWNAIKTMTEEFHGKNAQDKASQRWLECFQEFATLVGK